MTDIADLPDELRGDRVTLRPATGADVPALLAVARTPEVHRWWGDQDTLAADITGDEVGVFTISIDGAVVGMIQFDEEDDPEFRHAGIDVYLHPRVHGHGYGTDAVRTLARWLVADRGHHRLTIDPDARNHAAIRAYAKAGFKTVGTLRRYSDVHRTGQWSDGLLMDALAEDVLRGP
jgi:aminoglycoside 6'-N-acetyltransferase